MRPFYLIILLIIPLVVKPQALFEKQIVPFDAMDVDYFGQDVALNDSFLFVSSIRYQNTIEGCVYVYKYENNDYIFDTKIFPEDPEELALFGTRLLFQDGLLFVGAQNKKIAGYLWPVGSLYVFEKDGINWVQRQKIEPPPPYNTNMLFSNAIAKFDETLVISAFRANAGAYENGKVYVYQYSNEVFSLKQQISPMDPIDYQSFGTSLVVKENLLLVGCDGDSTASGFQSGSVYAYIKKDSLWIYSRKYFPEQNSQFLAYGSSMTSNKDFVFIGTSDGYQYNQSGKVYIYKRTDTMMDFYQIIESGENYLPDRFGSKLFCSGDSLYVTALEDTVNSLNSGAVYLFVNENDSWIKKRKITPSDEQNARWFGISLAFINSYLVVGANLSKNNNIFPGKVYIYSSTPLSVFDEKMINMPNEFQVSQNFPNPFNSTTRVNYYLPTRGDIVIDVINNLGQRIIRNQILDQSDGDHSFDLNLDGYSSGVYFITMFAVPQSSGGASSFQKTIKAILLK
ncbi:MAG: T9SS type A sorting domain-containing protein [Ignavibacterium sp.]|nr:T9SS type A sorting domain-containing protein [Ignavibacterium sp.]